MQIVRLYTGPDGQSHFEDLDVGLEDHPHIGTISELWPVSAVQFRSVTPESVPDENADPEFYNSPSRLLLVYLTGSVEVQVGSGERRILGPNTILLSEDTTGQGHASRNVDLEPRTSIYLHLDDA
jgi:hypothetical protein